MRPQPRKQRPAGGGPIVGRTTGTTRPASPNAIAPPLQHADAVPDSVSATHTGVRAASRLPQCQSGVAGCETRGVDYSDDQGAQIRAAVAELDADVRETDGTCAGGTALPLTPNSQGYTVAEFAHDIAPLLPLALPEFRKHGLMKACAHCGNQFGSGSFVLRHRRGQHGAVEAHILIICDSCAEDPAELSPNDWPHVRIGCGLLLQESEWAQFTRVLRRHVITTSARELTLNTTETP